LLSPPIPATAQAPTLGARRFGQQDNQNMKMTDLDVGLIMGSFLLGMISWLIKSFIHFDYLKQEKGKFENAESLVYLFFRPIYFFEYLPETFTIFNIPVLWNLKNNKLRLQIGVLSYCTLTFWTFAVLYLISGFIELLTLDGSVQPGLVGRLRVVGQIQLSTADTDSLIYNGRTDPPST
jgi:hypothetical protein